MVEEVTKKIEQNKKLLAVIPEFYVICPTRDKCKNVNVEKYIIC